MLDGARAKPEPSAARATAGWAARLVKDNEQADADDNQLNALRARIAERILQNEIFQMAVRPKALTPLMISRYKSGKQYGTHVDDALMGGMRTDISFTLFLTEPEPMRAARWSLSPPRENRNLSSRRAR